MRGPRRTVALISAGVAALAGAACETPEEVPSGPGRLVIIGGALQADNAPVYRAVLDGRSGDGPICVIPTASSDPEEAIEGAVETLDGYSGDGRSKGVLISTADPTRAQAPEVAEELRGCSGFYFTGGSQSRILDVFLPGGDTTAAYRALWARWQEGAVVAGSSAGAAMMSRYMIAGGSSDEAIEVGVAPDRESDGVQIRPGMGFFEPALLDQHFLARGRIGRLLIAALDPASPAYGLGIDENTALVVDGMSAAVVGVSGVVVVDASNVARVSGTRASGVRVALAGTGDVIDLGSFEVEPEATKSAVAVSGAPVDAPADPFERWAFLGLMVDLAVGADTAVSFALPGTTLTVSRGEGFSALRRTTSTLSIESAPPGFSAGPFEVDLVPEGS